MTFLMIVLDNAIKSRIHPIEVNGVEPKPNGEDDGDVLSYMDDVTHLDDLEDDSAPFHSELLFGPIAATYDVHFNVAKRQNICTISDDVTALGIVYSNYGRFLKFSPKQLVRIRDAFPTQQTTLSYSGSLSLLGKLPDSLVSGAWNSLFKHLLQGLVTKELHHRKVSWRSNVTANLFNLLNEWHSIVVENGTLTLPRLYDFNSELILSVDASKVCCGYEIKQNNEVYEEYAGAFMPGTAQVAIVVKEMKALYLGLASVYEIETTARKKFKKICVNTDNTVVATILKTKRVSGGRVGKRENCPVLQKYLLLLQELYPVSDWCRFEIQLVSTECNDADRLTRHPFMNKLIAFKEELTLACNKCDDYEDIDDEKFGYVHVAIEGGHVCEACDITIPTKLGIPIDQVRRAQEVDDEIRMVQSAIKNGLHIEPQTVVLEFYAKVSHELRIVGGILYWYCGKAKLEGPLLVPVLPDGLIPQAIKRAHEFGHTDVQQTVDVLRGLYFFPWMWKRTYDEVMKCERCFLNRKPYVVLPMRSTVTSTYPWQTLHMDIVSYGNLHLLTLIDSFSKYLCWEVLTDMSTKSVAVALQRSISKLGPPRLLIFDNAYNIGGPAVRDLWSMYNIEVQKSTEYYPRGNSVAERVHKTLHRLARLYRLQTPADIRRELHKLVYVYNCKPHRSLNGRSPYQVLFGRSPHTPANERHYDLSQLYLIWDEVRTAQAETFRRNKLYYDSRWHAQQRDWSMYSPGREVLLYAKGATALGVANKLGDAWEPGWKIARGPNDRYPCTVVIVKGTKRKVINLSYVLPDTRYRCEQEVVVNDERVSEIEERSANMICEIVYPDEEVLNQDEYILNENIGEDQICRRSTRRHKPVRRLTLGLGNSQSYDDKV